MLTKVVFLLDVDNTLLDNDRILSDLIRYIDQTIGYESKQRYWEIFEELREELGYADYLGALQGYRIKYPHDPRLLSISYYLLNYPFSNRLFPNSLAVIAQLKKSGPVVILSDGDLVFQPRKVEQAGLFEATNSNVLIYVHKELALEDIGTRYPAEHYVLVDDKLRILTAVKKAWGDRVTTVFPRQGQYALDPEVLASYPTADLSIEQIGDLLRIRSVGLNRCWGAQLAPPPI